MVGIALYKSSFNTRFKLSLPFEYKLNFHFWIFSPIVNCNTSGKCEDEILQSLTKSDRLYCMKLCQNNTLCRFSSYSEARNHCLLFKTCYKLGFNKNESSFLSSKVSCDLPPGGKYVWYRLYIFTSNKMFFFQLLVDCQLGPWTYCDRDCGLAGKTRFFGKWSNCKGVKCFQGDTWQKCGNLPPCAGDNKFISLLTSFMDVCGY